MELADLVDAAVAPHLRTAERSGRTVTVDAARVTVDVDARWLRPAIGNLLDNALRHGRGAGFPPEFLPRAFDRFARAETSRTSEGSGLGLAFVHAVATAHGGTAHAENTGRGARVVLDLPC